MGYSFFDQYSILHFATGIVAYFWGISLYLTVILHILFELFENTTEGMYFINKYFTMWPGGKTHADSLLNSTSDTIFTAIGWSVSYWLDKKYK
jgi:hypothetical protein